MTPMQIAITTVGAMMICLPPVCGALFYLGDTLQARLEPEYGDGAGAITAGVMIMLIGLLILIGNVLYSQLT